MSWLSKATGVHISPTRTYVDRNQVGNLLKNISPIAGAFTGGLGGMLLGGAGSALGRGVQKGANFGNILGQGAAGAGMASLGESALGGLKSAFGGASGSAAGGAGGAGGGFGGEGGLQSVAPPGPSPAQWQGAADSMKAIPPVSAAPAAAVAGAAVPPPAVKPPASAMSRVGSFADKYAGFLSGGLQGIGNIAQADSQNRLRNAQAQETEYDLAERRRRELALEPLRRALAGQLSGLGGVNSSPIAKNPHV